MYNAYVVEAQIILQLHVPMSVILIFKKNYDSVKSYLMTQMKTDLADEG